MSFAVEEPAAHVSATSAATASAVRSAWFMFPLDLRSRRRAGGRRLLAENLVDRVRVGGRAAAVRALARERHDEPREEPLQLALGLALRCHPEVHLDGAQVGG